MKRQRAAVRPTEKPGPSAGSAMLSEQAWKEIARSLKLSARELQIIQGVFDDCTELAIAQNLCISHRTVCTHRERLYRKLKVRDRVKLVLRIMEEYRALMTSSESDLPPICRNWASNRCPNRRK
jgi:DNA-binding NarL/FixJ family response regulator